MTNGEEERSRINNLVVVIEDHHHVREFLHRMLVAEDFEVEAFACYEEAIAAIQSEPRLVITDIELPDGSGLDLIRHLHEHWPEVPVIAISGQPAVLPAAAQAGATAVFAKPFSIEEFRAAVHALSAPR